MRPKNNEVDGVEVIAGSIDAISASALITELRL
jgi:hypothetical protein